MKKPNVSVNQKSINSPSRTSRLRTIFFLFVLFYSNYSLSLEYFDINQGTTPELYGQVSFGDLNGDGYNDIVSSGINARSKDGLCVTGYCDYTQFFLEPSAIWLNNQKGGFVLSEQEVDFGGAALIDQVSRLYVAIADVDNDGDNDLIGSTGVILLNDGDASFNNIGDLGIGFQGKPIIAADLNNDGIVEIINGVSIFKRVSTSPLQFQNQSGFEWNQDKNSRVSDFNNDGFKDLLLYSSESEIEIYFNDTFGGFTTENKMVLPYIEPLKLLESDVDNDGDTDLILSENRLLINQGQNGFVLEELFSVLSSESGDLQIVNYVPNKIIRFNDDEFDDIVLTLQQESPSSLEPIFSNVILLGDETGRFQYGFDYSRTVFLAHIRSDYMFLTNNTIFFFSDLNNDDIVDVLDAHSEPVFITYGFSLSFDFQLENFINPPVAHGNGLNSSYPTKIYLNNKTTSDSGKNYTSISVFNHMRSYIPPRTGDLNNDGNPELIYSGYSLGQFAYLSFYESPSYTVSYVSPKGFFSNKIDYLTEDRNHSYEIIDIFDFNNDGMDDLLIFYETCNEDFQCNSEKRILLNSESGIDENNYITYEFYGSSKADINGDSFIDLFYFTKENQDYFLKIAINNNGGGLSESSVLLPELTQYPTEITVHDFNNDDIDDILFLDSQLNLQIIYGGSDINSLHTDSILNQELNHYDLYEFDNDGDYQLFIIDGTRNELIIREYENGDYTNRLMTQSFDSYSYIAAFITDDLNNDGTPELIIHSSDIVSLYLADSSGHYTKELEIELETELPLPEIQLADLDGDGLKDIVYGSQIFLAREFLFETGLHYDPQHSGHGFSIENVGEDLFYSVFYTYDENNDPTWYSDLGLFEKPQEDYWNISDTQLEFIKYYYDYQTQTYNPSAETNDMGYIAHDKCSDKYGMINLLYGFGEGNVGGIPTGNAEENGEWCSQSIVDYYDRPDNDFSGLWWAGSEDSGWGWSVSLVQRDSGVTDMVVVLYYYDGEGNPRWLIGQQSGFEAGSEISIPMNMVKGYPRSQPATDLQLIQAGTLRMTLNQASQNILSAGTMSVDVTYPGPEGGSWIRNDIPVALFSTPRN